MLLPFPHTANIAVHIGAGVLGLAFGLVPLFSAKGGVAHRRWGLRFKFFAIIAVTTAILAVVFDQAPSALVAVTLSASYQLIGSLRALALRDSGPVVWDGLLAIAALGIAVFLFLAMGPGTPSWSPAIGYSTLGYVVAIALYDLSRHAWRDLWLRHARPLDHGLKMTGTYFAMASAGAGNLLRDYQPLSQILPSALGMLTMLVLVVLYLRRPAAPL
jgi:hypothetical protein